MRRVFRHSRGSGPHTFVSDPCRTPCSVPSEFTVDPRLGCHYYYYYYFYYSPFSFSSQLTLNGSRTMRGP